MRFRGRAEKLGGSSFFAGGAEYFWGKCFRGRIRVLRGMRGECVFFVGGSEYCGGNVAKLWGKSGNCGKSALIAGIMC